MSHSVYRLLTKRGFMLQIYPVILLIIILLVNVQTNAQWKIVKRLPAKPTTTLNVDVPPSTEMSRPIIWSMSFPDDLYGWAACSDGTLLRTVNGGTQWKRATIYPRVNTAIPFFATNSIGVFFVNRRTGWIVTEYKKATAILGTENGGQTWKIKYRINFKGNFHNIWFVDKKRGWAVGEAHDEEVDGGIVYETHDGGKTWNLQYAGGDNESFFAEINFADDLNGWAVGDNTVLHTSDGGKNWQRQNIPKDADFFGVDVLSSSEAWVVGSGGVILHTLDSGTSWSQVNLPPENKDHWLNSVKFVNSDNGWVVGNGGAIFFTNDRGKTWTLESKDTSSYLRGLATTKNHIFAFGNDGVIMQRSF